MKINYYPIICLKIIMKFLMMITYILFYQLKVFVLNVEKHAWEEIRLNEDVRNPERYLDEKGRLYVQFRTDSMDMYSDIPTPMISLEGRLENAEN